MRLYHHSPGLLLLVMMSGAALAQTTGAADPNAASNPDQAKQAAPRPNCMPIGITAAGEVVFPFECKDFLEEYKAEMDKPAAVGGAPNAPNGGTEPHVPEAAPTSSKAATPAVKDAPDSLNTGAAAVKDSPAAPAARTAAKPRKPERKIVDSDDEDNRAAPLHHASASKHKMDKGTSVCMHFRTYDPDSGTYRSYDGERRSCP